MTIDLSEVKKIAEKCGLFVGVNISCISLVVQKDEHGYHNHITLGELQSFAQYIYEMGAAEQKEKDAKICVEFSDSGFMFAEAIRSQE